MKFEFSDRIVQISPEKFNDKIGMSECKSVLTLLAEKPKFTKFAYTEKPEIDNSTYRSLVGSVNYVALSTRPDLLQAVDAFTCYQGETTMSKECAKA